MGDYSVSLKAPGRNKHFRVHVEGALYCIGQPTKTAAATPGTRAKP